MKITFIAYLILAVTSLTDCQSSKGPGMKHESTTDRDDAFAQYPDALYPIRVKNKWGYMNRKGEIMIKPTFAQAEDFMDGRAVAATEEEGKISYGYIDMKGQWIITPKYSRADPFYENRAAVECEEGYGYIDTTGKEIIPCKFGDAGRFSEGIAAVKVKGWTGFIDLKGDIVIEPKFTCSVQHPLFDHGMAPVFGADEKTGFINPKGEWLIEPKFHSAGRFREEKAWAMMEVEDAIEADGTRIKGGYINRQGEYIIQPEYDFGWEFFEGYATVWKVSDDRREKIWSVIDSTGNKILDNLMYRNMGSITSGLIPIQNEKMAWGFINIKGEVVIKPQFTGINRFNNGLARMEVGSAFDPEPIYINTKGEVVWKD